jgi:hypothetical protein
MSSIAIFNHSLRQVFGNLPAVLRISLVLSLVPLVAAFALGLQDLFGDPERVRRAMAAGRFPWGAFLLFLLLSAVCAVWIAVAWHRHVLLAEDPGSLLPPLNGDRMLPYVGAVVVLVLIAIPVVIVIGLVGGLILSPFAGNVRSMGGVIVMLVLSTLLIALPIVVIMMRFGSILPAAAVGKRLTLGEAWRATGGATMTIAGVVLMLLVLGLAIDLIARQLFAPGSTPAVVWGFLLQWFNVIFGLSIATTIYGHYVEHRPLR